MADFANRLLWQVLAGKLIILSIHKFTINSRGKLNFQKMSSHFYARNYGVISLLQKAITPEYYQQMAETARLKDAGLAATLELARLMGLRSQEAVRCSRSLQTWRQSLERGTTRLTIVFGTKGGRPRDTLIQDTGAVKQALDNAIAVAERRNGRLIDAASLKQAMKYWRNQTLRMGLTDKYSPALTALRLGAGRYPPVSDAGVQRKRNTGNGGDGPGAWRRARSLGEAGVRARMEEGITAFMAGAK